MSFQSPALPHFRLSPILTELARWTGRISVRARIVVLALIPVIGFLANGFTYVAGEGEVGHGIHPHERAACPEMPERRR